MGQVIKKQGRDELKTAEKVLIICVDRDDDVGIKANITTPAFGRDACIEAAQRLALEDPEDADSNSIFAAVKTYEDMVSKGYTADVVTVAGASDRGMVADRKIAKEIRDVLDMFPATGAVIVSDGEDDESVIPVIQGIVPIISVKRVVMKTSRTVEYSYAVLGKYLKMIAYDPKYSKFFLGLPGILFVIGGIGTVFGYTAEIFAVLASVFGGALLIRAFDVDRVLSSWSPPTPIGFIRLFMQLGGTVLIISSVPAGMTALDPAVFGMDIIAIITDKNVLGQFVAGALPILWVGMGAALAGAPLSSVIGRTGIHDVDILRLVLLGSLYPTVYQFTNIVLYDENSFTLIIPLLGGLAATLVAAGILYWNSHIRHRPSQMDQKE